MRSRVLIENAHAEIHLSLLQPKLWDRPGNWNFNRIPKVILMHRETGKQLFSYVNKEKSTFRYNTCFFPLLPNTSHSWTSCVPFVHKHSNTFTFPCLWSGCALHMLQPHLSHPLRFNLKPASYKKTSPLLPARCEYPGLSAILAFLFVLFIASPPSAFYCSYLYTCFISQLLARSLHEVMSYMSVYT